MSKKIVPVLSLLISITLISSIIPGIVILPKAHATGPDFALLVGGGSQGHQPSPADIGQSTTATAQLSGTLTNNPPTATITITNTNPELSCGSPIPNTIGSGGVTSLTCTATTRGQYSVTVTAANSTVSHSAIWKFWIQEFYLTPGSPSPVDAGIDATGSVTLTRLGVHPFNQTLPLDDTPIPSGLICGAFVPSSFAPGPATGVTANVACHSSTAGNYPLTVTAHFQNATDDYTNSTVLLFRVRQFSVSASAPTPIVAGQSASSTITITALNGFTGTVSLSSFTGSLSNPDNTLSCGAVSPNSITLGTSGTATISCASTVFGDHSLTIVASTSDQSYSSGVTVKVIGLICMASQPDVLNSKCPSTGPIYNGPVTTPPTILRVPVLSNNTGGLNGFDITLKSSDTNVLRPYGIDLSTSSYPTPTILTECVGLNLVSTGGTCGTTSTASTLRLAVSFAGLSSDGFTGTLFIAEFSIVGTVSSGAIPITYQTGCTLSSVTGTTDCILITNGGQNPVPVQDQAATFDNTDTTGVSYVTASSSAPSVGPFLPGATSIGSTTLTFTPNNGFEAFPNDGQVSLFSVVSAPGPGAKPTITLNGASTAAVDLTSGLPQTVTLSGSVGTFVPAGTYNATVIGTYNAVNTVDFTTTYSLAVQVTVQIKVVDYSLSASPNPVLSPLGVAGSPTSTLTVNPLNGFTGTVKLAKPTIPGSLTGFVTATYSSFVLTSSSYTSTLTLTVAANTPQGTYSITLNSNSTITGSPLRTRSMTLTLSVQPQDFTISASPTTVSVLPSVTGTSTITVASTGGLTGSVALTSGVVPSGMSCTLSPTSVTLGTSGTSTLSCSSPTNGTYTVTVTGTMGTLTHSTTVTYTVATPDFSVTASPTTVTVAANTAGTSTITVSSVSGYTGTITMTTDNTPACSLSTSPIVLGTSGTSTLTCTFATANVYTVTVTGTDNTLTHTATVTFTVTAGDFTITAAQTSVTSFQNADGTDSITIGSVSGFSGTVTLTTSIRPTAGMGCAFGSSTITGGTGITTLTCNGLAVPKYYNVTVIGTSGFLTHNVTIKWTVTVPHTVSLTTTFTTGQTTAGNKVPIVVTIQNTGSQDETVVVNVYADNFTVATEYNVAIPANSNQTVTLNWDTTGYTAKQYKMAVAVVLPNGEQNTASGVVDVGTYTVTSASTGPIIDQTTMAAIVALAIVAIIAALLVQRRRKGAKYGPTPQKN